MVTYELLLYQIKNGDFDDVAGREPTGAQRFNRTVDAGTKNYSLTIHERDSLRKAWLRRQVELLARTRAA
jgi:hypothetical protein